MGTACTDLQLKIIIKLLGLINKQYVESQFPLISTLIKNADFAVIPENKAKLLNIINKVYNPYGELNLLNRPKKRTMITEGEELGGFSVPAVSIAEMIKDPDKYGTTLTDLKTRMDGQISNIAGNFSMDYIRVIEDLRRDKIKLPLFRQSQMYDLFNSYMSNQITKNTGMLVGTSTDSETGAETPTATVGVLDKNHGQEFIRSFIDKLKPIVDSNETDRDFSATEVAAIVDAADARNKRNREGELDTLEIATAGYVGPEQTLTPDSARRVINMAQGNITSKRLNGIVENYIHKVSEQMKEANQNRQHPYTAFSSNLISQILSFSNNLYEEAGVVDKNFVGSAPNRSTILDLIIKSYGLSKEEEDNLRRRASDNPYDIMSSGAVTLNSGGLIATDQGTFSPPLPYKEPSLLSRAS